MEEKFWHDRWKENDIAFHQSEINRTLIEFFPKRPGKVFVPLCGKSQDMNWLVQQGHEVVGVEFSPLACRNFFLESQLSVEESKEGDFLIFRGEKITLWCGDYFLLPPRAVKDITLGYDRAALVALPPPLRVRYAAKTKALFPNNYEALLISFEYPRFTTEGPPFSVEESEINTLFADHFTVKPLRRANARGFRSDTRFALAAKPVQECVYSLVRIA